MDRLVGHAQAVDGWYRRHARRLTWRLGPVERDQGLRPDPYRVWLAEVMLQQTTVPHAAPYFDRFVQRWPAVADLALESWEAVSAAWAGLGYYSRARNLHVCARVLAEQGFPRDIQGLRALPGIGPYTAAAIAAIAFDAPVAPVDGNIERVMMRLFAINSDRAPAGWRSAKQQAALRAQALFDASPCRPGDLAQGLMDLGATICTPTRPACALCPLHDPCLARLEGEPDRYPMKPKRSDLPERHGAAFVLLRPSGEVLLRRRPPSGLLGGMLMPPTSAWADAPVVDPLQDAPGDADWEPAGDVRHVFTHFALSLSVWRGDLKVGRAKQVSVDGEWVELEAALASLPTVGRKAVALAVKR